MSDNPQIDMLLKLRGQIGLEIQGLTDALAVKRKALAALEETIDLLRGWTPEPEPVKRQSHDKAAIREAILEAVLQADAATGIPMREIIEFVSARGLLPANQENARKLLWILTKDMPEIEGRGKMSGRRYFLTESKVETEAKRS